MKAVGLIVEYNPFHNGHLHHLQQSKIVTESQAVVAVMSGHFLQRGEPAMTDKWTRTSMALQGGCDLVIELPVAYATSSAEWFAYGAVALLNATGIVDRFCFGTESGMLAPLQLAASIAAEESPLFKQKLTKALQLGMNYPKAYSAAMSAIYQEQTTALQAEPFRFDLPNHTLGLHYLIALHRLSSKMTPYTIPREQAQYSDITPTHRSIASATSIRHMLIQSGKLTELQRYVPETTYQLLVEKIKQKQAPIHWEHYFNQLLHLISVQSPEKLAAMREVEEGLQHRIKQSLAQLNISSFEAYMELLKTKRYTRTKLQRTLLSILLQHEKHNFTKEALASGLQYIRVLGFTQKGQALLKEMKTKAALPIVLHAKDAAQYPYLQLDVQATAAYMLGVPASTPDHAVLDYRRSPIIL